MISSSLFPSTLDHSIRLWNLESQFIYHSHFPRMAMRDFQHSPAQLLFGYAVNIDRRIFLNEITTTTDEEKGLTKG
jgi:hypothetical protein